MPVPTMMAARLARAGQTRAINSSRCIKPSLTPRPLYSSQSRSFVKLTGASPSITNGSSATSRITRQLPSQFFVRNLSGKPLPQGKSWLLNFCYRAAAWVGISISVIGAGVVGFFIYDASTYFEHPNQSDIDVSKIALQPRSGGEKNLPIAEVYIDDDDTEEHRRLKDKPRLVILGGGWGGVALLKELNPDDYHVTVISPTNYFLFTPMLPSATVGTLELRSLVEPIRRILSRVNGHFIRAKAEDVDFSHKMVEVSQVDASGKDIRFYVPYDKLVIAVGSTTNPHGVKGLENAFFLKDINDARKIRNQVIQNFELANLPTCSDEERKRLLSFCVSGGGPTGVEFAAELFDLLNEDLTRHFPRLLRNEISVHLIQSRSHILNTYDETVSRYAEDRFARDQVDVQTNSRVKEVLPDKIIFTQKQEGGETITKELPIGFCLWSTGVSQTQFCQTLAARLRKSQTNRHALETDTHLRLNGSPMGDVYAIGDCSTVQNNVADHVVTFLRSLAWKRGKDPETLQLSFADWRSVADDVKKRFPQAVGHLKRVDKLFKEFDKDKSGTLDFDELTQLLRNVDNKLTSLPATAQRAHQQGQYLARKFNRISRLHEGLDANDIRDGDVDAAVYKAFEYKHLGSLAYVGNSAIFDLGEGRSIAGGLWAVYAWRSVYFAQSVSLRTRLLMAMDWTKRGLFGRGSYSS
ncbi:nadh dehydrogenase [Fusarium sporotrichioides]|uniref:Nadh dehydrogenase n=1 Tax=Fusarium sporotrichioides TaxID=5514 RepID=A0A395RN43_FUSSP|nr:nadh dehydrogenase [Fusarium sporotrichioides]